jgi:acyl-coenzyme A thioesterase PaaI-like protein
MPNRLARLVGRISKVPKPFRPRALTTLLGNAVPFVGTAGVVIEELTPSRCVVVVRNRRRVQNHIRSVHAAAITLLAETASGMVVGMNVPEDRVPVVKTIGMEFKKRSKGDIRVIAVLTDEQRRQIADLPKGELSVAVKVVDGEEKEPVMATMIWAWTPKRTP